MANYFMVRALKIKGQSQIDMFRKEGVVRIGWPKLGDLKGQSKEDIKQTLIENYQNDGSSLASVLYNMNTFVNVINIGDILLVPVVDCQMDLLQ